MLPPVILFLLPLSFFVVRLQVLLEGLVFAETSIEPVFDVVVDPTGHQLLNLNPLVAIFLMQLHQLKVLCDGPLLFVQIWVHIVVPAFAALFANSARQESRDLLPLFEA